MATVIKFEDLEVWKRARQLNLKVRVIAQNLRKQREFRFADQLSSSSGSIMDNIAEGFERNSRLEFINSLGISKGEIGELKSQLYRCLDHQCVSQTDFKEIYGDAEILAKKIASFIIYLNNTQTKGLKFKDRT